MELKKMQIGLFRHGKSAYVQREVKIEDAYDLLPEGAAAIIKSANEFSHFLSDTRAVEIYSSPFGRTLYSAQLAMEVFRSKGIHVNSANAEKDLEELRNFNWKLFEPLVNGGKLNYNGETLTFDAKKTNPKNLTPQQYIMEDAAQEIADRLRGKYPYSYLEELSVIEPFSSVRERMKRFLGKLAEDDSEKDAAIFTHEALVYDIMSKFTNKRSHALAPGGYIHLEKNSREIYVRSAGNITEGDTKINILK